MKWILIVDDEASIRESLKPILESAEVGVVSASSVEEAMGLISNYTFDLVITDLRLTGTHGAEGLELISKIKERSIRTHVVLMTAFRTDGVESEARKRGAVDCWQKSILIQDILQRIRLLGIPVGSGSA